MSDLREPLRDLLDDIPAYVVPDARAAWTIGARRRRRRRVGAVAAAAVVVALLATVATGIPRAVEPQPAGGQGGGVDGYPGRIGYPYWSPTVDDDPGELTGVVERVSHKGTADQPLGWYGVGTSGRLWKLPAVARDSWPSLSPDGRELGYPTVSHPSSMLEYEILHLSDGSVSDVSVGGYGPDRSPGQFPSFWSPDSRRVVFAGGLRQGRALVFDVDGHLQRIRTGIAGWPVGWTDAATLAWLRLGRDGRATVVMTDLRGRTLRSTQIALPPEETYFGQWTGTVSPDGSRIALASEDGTDVRVYSLATGESIGDPVLAGHLQRSCSMSWSGVSLRIPVSDDAGALLRGPDLRPVVMADPRLQARCSLWAADALRGDRRDGISGLVFGTSNGWLSWHWREVGAGATAGLAVLALLLLVRRRRRRATT